MLAQQPATHNRKRNTHKRRNAYHAPADMTALQQNIAAVTLNHIRQGKAVDYRNLAITYPLAFDLVYVALGETEKVETGMVCNEASLRRRLNERERERFEALR